MNTNTGGIIFSRAFRDARRSILGWGLGMVGLSLMVSYVYPNIGMMTELNAMLENPMIKALVGDIEEMTSPAGFIGTKLFAMLPLILSIYIVTYALNMVAGEEERGTLDVLLSTPVPRWRVIVEKSGALVIALVLILLLGGLGLMLGVALVPELELATGNIVKAIANVIPVSLFIGATGLFLSTALRSRARAGAITAALVVGSYFVDTISELLSGGLKQIQNLSFYAYYDSVTVLRTGIVNWGHILLLLTLTAVLFGLSLYFFERRDLIG